MEAVHHNHCVFRLSYHVVLVVKYRRKCITPEIGDLLTAKAGEFLASRGGSLLEGKCDRDHMHLLIAVPPTVTLSEVIGTLKRVTSMAVRRQYQPYLKRFLWGNAFWTSGYYIATTGDVNENAVRHYIQHQRECPPGPS